MKFKAIRWSQTAVIDSAGLWFIIFFFYLLVEEEEEEAEEAEEEAEVGVENYGVFNLSWLAFLTFN